MAPNLKYLNLTPAGMGRHRRETGDDGGLGEGGLGGVVRGGGRGGEL